jgi:cytochrome b561
VSNASSVAMAAHRYAGPRDEFARFGYVAIFYHWIVAVMILANILVAWQFPLVHGSLRSAIFQIHKSIGISVLLLSVLRLAWRLLNPPPPFPNTMRAWERSAAKLVERSFYFVMLALPLTGWAIVSTASLPISTILFGLVHWPNLFFLSTLPFDQKLVAYKLSVGAHHLLAKITYALFALHVLAALRHQFIKRDTVLARMIPFLARRGRTTDLRGPPDAPVPGAEQAHASFSCSSKTM